MSFLGQYSFSGKVPETGWNRYLSWRVCQRMLQKSHRHHRRHQTGRWALGGTSFFLGWAARASGVPSVMEQRLYQTYQHPLWGQGGDSQAVSQCVCMRMGGRWGGASWLYRKGKTTTTHREILVTVYSQNTVTGLNTVYPFLLEKCRVTGSLKQI